MMTSWMMTGNNGRTSVQGFIRVWTDGIKDSVKFKYLKLLLKHNR